MSNRHPKKDRRQRGTRFEQTRIPQDRPLSAPEIQPVTERTRPAMTYDEAHERLVKINVLGRSS